MKFNLYAGIAIRIIFLCVIGMLSTYLVEPLRGFFGDTPCTSFCGLIDPDWDWGARHYWYWWMMFLLFTLSLVSIIVQIIHLINKYYKVK